MEKKNLTIIVTIKIIILTIVISSWDSMSCQGTISDTAQDPGVKVEIQDPVPSQDPIPSQDPVPSQDIPQDPIPQDPQGTP